MTHNLKVLPGIIALALVTTLLALSQGPSSSAQLAALPDLGIAASPSLTADQTGHAEKVIAAPSHIAIPAIGVYTTVVNAPRTVESWDVSGLGWQAGHLEGTAYPGQGSNVVVGAHRYQGVNCSSPSLPGPFAAIDRLQPGDSVEVTAGGHVYVYAVTEQLRVARHEVWVAGPADHEVLTLLSCDTWNPQTLRFEKRLVVRADLVEVR